MNVTDATAVGTMVVWRGHDYLLLTNAFTDGQGKRVRVVQRETTKTPRGITVYVQQSDLLISERYPISGPPTPQVMVAGLETPEKSRYFLRTKPGNPWIESNETRYAGMLLSACKSMKICDGWGFARIDSAA